MHNHVLCICCGKDVKSKILVNIVEGAMNKIKLDIQSFTSVNFSDHN